MSKKPTLASMARVAARSEKDFIETINGLFERGDAQECFEFFDRLNIPRSQGAEGLLEEIEFFGGACVTTVFTFEEEAKLSKGMQKFLERHERKIRWHAGHPGPEGVPNVLLLFRAAIMVTRLRTQRLHLLLSSKDELTPDEWWQARELMNGTYQSFRKFLTHVASSWIDAVRATVDHQDLSEAVGPFHKFVDDQVRSLEEARERVEERRSELTVLPEGHPPVKPPLYFGGDVLGRGPWTQYWKALNSRAHHFRESVG